MRISILGKHGQIARNLSKILPNAHVYSSKEINFLDIENLAPKLANLTKSDLIINAVGYTQVDLAEQERVECDIINHQAVAIIARYCANKKIKLIHYSTDYVFDGKAPEIGYKEDDKTNPINYYGKTKLDGENAIINSGCEYMILRTSGIYDLVGINFPISMIRLMKENKELKIVSDQGLCQSYAPDIALYTKEMIDKFQTGIYHLVNDGYYSWYDFALLIKNRFEFETTLIPIETSEYKTPAKRPLNGKLNIDKIKTVFNIYPRSVEDAIMDFMDNYSNDGADNNIKK